MPKATCVNVCVLCVYQWRLVGRAIGGWARWNGWSGINGMESNMWFPYVWYRSIYSIPANTMSLFSYSSSNQPPLVCLCVHVCSYVNAWRSVHKCVWICVFVSHPSALWIGLAAPEAPQRLNWSKPSPGIQRVHNIQCQPNCFIIANHQQLFISLANSTVEQLHFKSQESGAYLWCKCSAHNV